MAAPYRADHVGSLLRPPELLQARQDHAEGKISAEQLREAEDAAVLQALELQRQAGVDVYTEGEYRRAAWMSAMRSAVDGLVPAPAPAPVPMTTPWRGPSAEQANAAVRALAAGGVVVAGAKIRQVQRLAAEESAFLRQHAPGPWKITIPGPMHFSYAWFRPGVSEPFYPTRQDLTDEIVAIIQREMKALIDEGVSYLQLDSLHYVERVANTELREQMIAAGEDPDAYLDEVIAADNAALAGIRGTAGVTVGLHMCRGNNRSAWHAEGGYEPVAEKAFQLLNVDRFLLEFDTERAGGFEPLRFVPRDKMVVLGLVSSKEPALESVDQLRRRIDEATKYVPIENLALSPQCGFASTAPGNLLTWDEQRRKLERVAETARAVWG